MLVAHWLAGDAERGCTVVRDCTEGSRVAGSCFLHDFIITIII